MLLIALSRSVFRSVFSRPCVCMYILSAFMPTCLCALRFSNSFSSSNNAVTVLTALQSNLSRKAKGYESPPVACIFQLNNYAYILQYVAVGALAAAPSSLYSLVALGCCQLPSFHVAKGQFSARVFALLPLDTIARRCSQLTPIDPLRSQSILLASAASS